jgi:hypothetical protein
MNPIRDIKHYVNSENNKVMALLWLVEATLLINILI